MPSKPAVALRNVSFSYPTSPEPLFSGLSVHLPEGFTGVVGANGTGKSTLLHLLTGSLEPSSGSVEGATHAIYCAQRTDDPPDALPEFLDDWETHARLLRTELEVHDEAAERWSTLSQGERKRAQIAVALWQQPQVLAIDEPTNHIDASTRDALLRILETFPGVGLLVSHDREFLDTLCTQCIWIEPPTVDVYAGGYTAASEQRAQQDASAHAERDQARHAQRALQREVTRRRDQASREHQTRSKKHVSRKDSDARDKINRRKNTDSKAGQPLNALKGHVERAQSRIDAAQVRKRYETGIWMPGSRSQRTRLLAIEGGTLQLGTTRTLNYPPLEIRPDDRIGITGVNGAGKSTLLRELLPRFAVPADHLVAIPQEVTAAEATETLKIARGLPRDKLGHLMNVVSRLGSRPQRLLDSRLPSPGETRKLMLALGMANAPHLIVMDEPTNHLDLPSIEALEDALAECPCALVLISHDSRFLRRLTRINWQLDENADGDVTLCVTHSD